MTERMRLLIASSDTKVEEALLPKIDSTLVETTCVVSSFEVKDARSQDGAFSVALLTEKIVGSTGFEMIRWLKELNPDLYAILLADYSDSQTVERARKAGADTISCKPCQEVDALGFLVG
ncbi:hypothetical protein KAI87_16935, partial [Myxococcota bacterium]|nr:hypothetical protein [Myxococcota bacterium]